jgi:hypothetical protein
MPSRRRLADGRSSRGYVPLEVELFDVPLSAEARGFLASIRHDSTTKEHDGDIDGLALQGLAVYCQVPRNRLARVIQELRAAGVVKQLADGGLRDLNYPAWSKTRSERAAERDEWRGRKQRSRQAAGEQMPLPVTPMSRRDMDGNHAPVPDLSHNTSTEAETETETEGGPPTSAPDPPREAKRSRLDERNAAIEASALRDLGPLAAKLLGDGGQ